MFRMHRGVIHKWRVIGFMVSALAGLFPCTIALAQTMASTVSQSGITWNFDRDYLVGQFITGDYWVVGPVTITQISPGWNGSRHGTMINSTGADQGLDAYVDPTYGSIRYSASLNIESGDGLPVTVQADNSVISAIGRPTSEATSAGRLRPMLKSIAVLTVLSEEPPPDAFRPSYVGTNKTIYRWSEVQQNLWRLPNRAPVTGAPSVSSYVSDMQSPWALLTVSGWQGRYFHAVDNMDSYHREVGRTLGAASVLLMMDVSGRQELLRHYIQVGIDYYAVSQNMAGTSAQWQWPVIFTGIMLGDDDMRDVYLTGNRHPENLTREEIQLYRLPGENGSTVNSSIVPNDSSRTTWTGSTAAWWQDGPANCYYYEHLHPSEWSSVSNSQSCSQGLSTRETYRRINSPAYASMAIAAAAMDARTYFPRSDLFFDYAERWMREDLSDSVHDVYRNSYTSDETEYGSTTKDWADAYYERYGWTPANVDSAVPRPPEQVRAE